MHTEKSQDPDLVHISRCVSEAKDKLQLQQKRVEQASCIGLSVYEEKGRLMIMIEALEMMTKKRAELIKAT